MEDYYNYYL